MEATSPCSTGISECMKLNLVDILEFLSDFHAISKMKVRSQNKEDVKYLNTNTFSPTFFKLVVFVKNNFSWL